MIWDIDPAIVRFGGFELRYYSLLFLLSFVLSQKMMAWIFQKEGKDPQDIDRLLIHMVVGTILGARLGHVLFYEPQWLWQDPLQVFKVWEGGLASHGAAVGIILALFLYLRGRQGQSFSWILDRVVMGVALSGFFIRIGNFFNSEIYGTPTTLPWAVTFARVDLVPRHPAQLYESLFYGLVFMFLFGMYLRFQKKPPQFFLAGWFFVLVFGFRFAVEFLKEVQVGFEKGMALNMGQILSIPLVGLGLLMLVHALKKNPKTPVR